MSSKPFWAPGDSVCDKITLPRQLGKNIFGLTVPEG